MQRFEDKWSKDFIASFFQKSSQINQYEKKSVYTL